MFEKIKGSIKGVLGGGLIFILSFPLIFWNECESVEVYKSIDEGQKVAVETKSASVDNSKNGKLVVTSGMAGTTETIRDSFGFSQNALVIRRTVDMQQWVEKKPTKEEAKKGKEPTYSLAWRSSHVDSSNYKNRSKYNPPMAIKSGNPVYANHATLGAYRLEKSLLMKMDGEKYMLSNADKARINVPVSRAKRIDDGTLYLGSGENAGDYRISYNVVKPQESTVLAKQKANRFIKWMTSNDKSLFNIRAGNLDIATMMSMERDDNFLIRMVLRVVAFLMMAGGLSLIFKPFSDVADMVPLVGNMLQAGIGIFATLLAAFICLISIALAWVVARPVLGIGLLILAIAIIVGLVMLAKKKKAAAPATDS